ncbi:MAG: NADH-quinone oxidoreductase subunit L [Candidatus Gastranaerophilales bacterium]|nr:NADH-quinone oxidoreductase subunit L [Candidatus Gastranaerophilales bacterium]
MELILQNIWVVAILPLFSFLFIIIGQKGFVHLEKKISMYLTVGVTFLGWIFSVFALIYAIQNQGNPFQENFVWMYSGSLTFSMGYLIDELSSVMLFMVTSISLLIQIYSHSYMKEDPSYHRFFAYLSFFNFAMIGLVLSSNLFQTYIFWELVGLASYLLIGFWYKKNSASKAAQKAFLVNRIGDFGLLLGIMGFLFLSYNFWFYEADVLLGFSSLKQATEVALVSTSSKGFFVVAFLMFLGPVAKSAQFPLHVWLPDAMEAPTPVSALIHAATMVAAGVFLTARLYPIFILSPVLMQLIAYVGAITALLAACMALVQYDIKKALAYSTCSQLGYMFLALGVGAYSAGMFHLLIHAYVKALLFLCAGAVIHSLSSQQDMRYMGGLRKQMPVVAYTYLIGCLSLSGIFLSGFSSKEQILSGILASGNMFLFYIALFTAGLSAFYIFRTYFMVFEGKYKGESQVEPVSKVMSVPLIVLAVPSAVLGVLLSWCFDDFVSFGFHTENHFVFLPLISIVIALFSVWLASIFYWDKKKLIDTELVKLPLKSLHRLFVEKFFIDWFYDKILNKIYAKAAYVLSKFDRFVVDASIDITFQSPVAAGKLLNIVQHKKIGAYILVSVFLLVLLCGFIMSILNLIV